MGKRQRSIDIARSLKVVLRDILTYDHAVQSQIFDGNMTAKPDKSCLMNTLESSLFEDNYKVDKIKVWIIIDFMSSIKKIPFSNFSTFSDVFESIWNQWPKFDTIHIVYDNYIGDSIKETFKESDPLEYIDLFLQSPLPVQLDWFWGCSRNKEKIQAWSRSFFSDKSKLSNKTIILNGYTSNSGESFSADKYIEGSNNILTELEFPIGEADLWIKPHV